MPNIDDYLETPKSPGADERLIERQQLRLERKLNAPVPGPHGLSNYVLYVRKKSAHKIDCKCLECIPDELQDWLDSRKKAAPAKKQKHTVLTKKANPPKPRKSRWKNRWNSSN